MTQQDDTSSRPARRTPLVPLAPFGGDTARWQQAHLEASARRARAELHACNVAHPADRRDVEEQLARRGHVLEVTDVGWIRWQQHGPQAADATAAEIAVCAPRWRRGRRARLLRRLHLHGPRLLLDRPPFTVPLYPVLTGIVLFVAGLAGLGPYLRGQVAVALPLALAYLPAFAVPLLLRRVTLRHMQVIDGRDRGAMRMRRVLAARRVLRRAAADGVPGAAGRAAVADSLVWAAAQAADCGRDEELKAVVDAATALVSVGHGDSSAVCGTAGSVDSLSASRVAVAGCGLV